ncbi:MAG: glycogen/starch synthase [Anaerolineae bacterium]
MMPPKPKTLRVAMPAWEIGRANTGLGVKIGGLGVVVEELPPALAAAAARRNLNLHLETLTPCFAFYDRSRLTRLKRTIPVTLDGTTFEFEVYKHTFPDGQTVVYFWDDWQLNWTTPTAIYPDDPAMALKLYAAVSQAMAGYIKQGNFHTVHSHDYHVGLIPFYLGDEYLARVPHHFTIHNATYQGNFPVHGRGYQALERINLPGEKLFHQFFDHFDHLNLMKAAMIKTHQSGGKITTVSGDIAGTWGYAAELRRPAAAVWAEAQAQKQGGAVGQVFVPNGHLDTFEKLPIAGITNGLSRQNRPENLPQLTAAGLKKMQAARPDHPLFTNPDVQRQMLAKDHTFDANRLHIKSELKRLLHLEAFGAEPAGDPILFTAVGRLAAQKNLGLIADIIQPTLHADPEARFIILASAPEGDPEGKATEAAFAGLARQFPARVYVNNSFNLPLSKLILAGGDFTLIPSRFEPCGLVDYEASLLGTIVIGRLTGGLAKVQHCAYLYRWLDISDRAGEAAAFFEQISAAIETYRRHPARHWELMKQAMTIDASWDRSAMQYVNMYRYGLLAKKWQAERQKTVARFIKTLKEDGELFADFFVPARHPYSDPLDRALKAALEAAGILPERTPL